MSIPQTNIRVQAGSAFPNMPGTAFRTFSCPVHHHSPSLRPLPGLRPLAGGLEPGYATWRHPHQGGTRFVLPPSKWQASGWFQETAEALRRASRPSSPVEQARAAASQGLTALQRDLSQPLFTEHAFLFAWAEFAYEIGLIQKLAQVPMPEKSVVHTPQAKALAFLLGILIGITDLRDLNEGHHPLAHDVPVLQAWGLASLAHYTGIESYGCQP